MISLKFLEPDLTFRIGKHREKHISEVDRFYLEWCVKEGREKMKPLEVDIFKAFIKHKKDYAKRMEEKKADLPTTPPNAPVLLEPFLPF